MNSINSIQGVRNYRLPVFEQKNTSSSPIVNSAPSDVSMNGVDALAGYNFNLVNKNKDFNNIPNIKIIPIPEDISKIDGEKIYNSKGDLVSVIKDIGKNQIIYKNDKEHSISIIDKTSGKILKSQECFTSVNNNRMISVYEKVNDKISYGSLYKEEDGNLTLFSKSKNIKYDDGSEKEFIYEVSENEFRVINRAALNEANWYFDSAADYDEQGNLKYLIKNTHDTETTITANSIDGQIYSYEEVSTRSIPNNLGEKYKNDKDLIPAKPLDIPQAPENIEGIKTYYSNGVVETNQVGDILYSFDFNGKLTNIDTPNKKMVIYEDGMKDIEEILPNGAKKTTTIYPNSNNLNIRYMKGNAGKSIDIINGKILAYDEMNNGKGFCVDFSADGSVRDIREMEYDNFDD